MKKFSIENISSKKGRIAIVTGANDGLGYETTKAFCKKDIKVIMACRNIEKAQDARNRILKKLPSANIDLIKLDLSDLQSVHDFAHEFNSRYNRLDFLINNAGLMMPPYQKTKDGFESQFGINYLGHFALTGLLIDKLLADGRTRIVTLSSLAHKWGDIYFEDINFDASYNPQKAYGQSKLACLMFSYELNRRLKNKRYEIMSLAAHPGVATTSLTRYVPKWQMSIGKVIAPLLFQKPKKGALPTLRAALDPEARGGDYYGPNGFKEMKGDPVKVDSSKTSKDTDKARELWSLSEQMTGVSFLS